MNMIEKVARAIDKEGQELAIIDGNKETQSAFNNEKFKAIVIALAKAAMAAMREPTEEMRGPGLIFSTDDECRFRAVIDAALKE